MRVILLLLSFVALVYCDYVPTTLLHSENGTVGGANGLIYYTNSSNFFSLPNIQNPLTVQIVYPAGTGGTANICFNPQQSDLPVPGNNLNNACPSASFTTIDNTTAASIESAKLKFTRKNTSLRGQFLSKMVEDDETLPGNAIYGAPTNGNTAGFVVTTTSTAALDFQILLYGSYCDGLNEFANNGSCLTATQADLNNLYEFTVEPSSWAYYTFTTPTSNPTIYNQFTVITNVTSNAYIQRNYIPTTTYFLAAEKSGNNFIINTPGTTENGDTYYVGFWNPSTTASIAGSLNVTFTGCEAGKVGPGCAVNTTATNTTDGSTVILLSATLNDENNGNAIEVALSDSDNEFAYFQLYNFPQFVNQTNDGFPYYVHVSVGNTNLEDDNDNFGPQILAKAFGYPSLESYDYSVAGSVANQVILPVQNINAVWYIAVKLPSDFSIWVGVNCAQNCSNNDHGSCNCAQANGAVVDCQSIANSTNQYYPLYSSLPNSINVSPGYCSCSDSDYQYSFDCSQKSSPTVLFIVLIVIGALIILFVAIGVPLYCYISNKRKERYERI